jgi:hypothetical protein
VGDGGKGTAGQLRGVARPRRRAYLDRSLELEQNGLGDEDLASLGAKIADLGLEKLHLLPRTTASNLKETVDYRVEIDLVLVRHLDSSPASRLKRGQ